jgi:hypothetical protein
MPDREPAPDGTSDPNFVLVRINAIHEDNWPEYEAQGFVPLKPIDRPDPDPTAFGELDITRSVHGDANIYTGDAWDEQAGRPLRHKPGGTMYLRMEAEEDPTVSAEMRKWYRERYERRLREDQARGGPASS